jgi:capsular exopolysaccharide synthesis family protein
VAAEKTENGYIKSDSTPYVGADSQENIHLRAYLQVIQKHKWTVVTAFVAIVTTVVIGTFSITPIFTSTTTIQIEKEPLKVLEFEDVLPIDGSGADYYQTQQEIIQSRAIAKRVIQRLSLWNHPQFKAKEKNIVSEAEASIAPINGEEMEELIDSFHKLLEVKMIKNSRLAMINFSSHYPELSAEVSNAVANAYIDFNLEYKFKATKKARDWLTEQLGEFQAKVEKSEEALNSFARRHGIFSLEKDENLLMMRLEELNESFSSAKADRIARESFYKEVKGYPPQSIPSAQSEDLLLINDLKVKLSGLEAEYFNLSKLYKPDYPRMVRLKAEIEAIEARIEKEAENLVKRAEVNYKISLKREKLLSEALEKQKELALKIKEKAIQYNILKREVDTNKELYDGLLQRVKETGVSAGLESSNIQIVDSAEMPLYPSRPNKKLNILLSIVMGLFFGVGLAFFLEYYDNTIKNPDEIMKLFNLPTLGLIPSFQSTVVKRRRRDKSKEPQPAVDDLYLVSQSYPRSSISEACRTFRTSLLFSTPGHPPKTILITSNNPREGKTFVSCNLGIVLAQGGAKTLIIDSDLRRPSIHRVFSVQNAPGLTDHLTGHATLNEIIRSTDIKGLFVLPAGPISPNPPELLDSIQFKEAIEELKGEFDFIIFDSAPIMNFADTLNLASKIDGAIIVAHNGKTTRDDIRHSVGLLRGVNASILGVVVNIINIRKNDYYYHYYYYGEGSEKRTGPAVS